MMDYRRARVKGMFRVSLGLGQTFHILVPKKNGHLARCNGKFRCDKSNAIELLLDIHSSWAIPGETGDLLRLALPPHEEQGEKKMT